MEQVLCLLSLSRVVSAAKPAIAICFEKLARAMALSRRIGSSVLLSPVDCRLTYALGMTTWMIESHSDGRPKASKRQGSHSPVQ